MGLWDGVSGLVTQPMKGAEEGGFMGGLIGFGKGLGGAVFKPAAGKATHFCTETLTNIVSQVLLVYPETSLRESMKRFRNRVLRTWKATPLRYRWYRDLRSGRLLQKRNEVSFSCGSRERLKTLRHWKVRTV